MTYCFSTRYCEEDLRIYKDNPIVLQYEVNGKPKEVTYWLAEVRDPCKEPVLSDEHSELKWLTKDDAKKTVGFRDNQEMIEKFHQFLLANK